MKISNRNLTREEKQILSAFERGELKSLPDAKLEKKRIEKIFIQDAKRQQKLTPRLNKLAKKMAS